MTPLLDRLEELLRAGTDRPWTARHSSSCGGANICSPRGLLDGYIGDAELSPDANLIVAAVNSLPALLRRQPTATPS